MLISFIWYRSYVRVIRYLCFDSFPSHVQNGITEINVQTSTEDYSSKIHSFPVEVARCTLEMCDQLEMLR